MNKEEFEKKIDDQNSRISGLVVNIAVSLITTIIVFCLLKKGLRRKRNDKYSVGNYVRSNNVLRMGGRK